ncbi:Crystal protein ET79 [Streptomyces sp. NPDC005931]|uniref:Crystal protein ET79 n=1 Tax=Streptomyces sp. NPDC005931 TaxID=3364737 RepID=UPI0036A57E94
MAVLTSGGSSSAATGHDTARESTPSVQSARSTRVHVVNGTTTTMYRNYSSLSHGVWDDATPPEVIDGGTEVVWGSHSSGVMTGTEGDALYSIGNAGELSIHWNNPYVGSNTYSCTAPAGYTCTRSGGSGNNAEVWFTISGSGRTAAPHRGERAAAAARSTHVTLQNRTPNEMVRTSSSLTHGTWSENLLPPDRVYPMSNAIWQSESNGFMTGTEGQAVYNMFNVGTVGISWNNPYVGDNTYSCSVPPGYTCRQDGGRGDNAAVTFTVMKR